MDAWHASLPSRTASGRTEISPDVPPFYQYEPLAKPRSIRILELLPGSTDPAVYIKLKTVNLDESPRYEALSYEWSLPESRRTIPSENPRFAIDITMHLRRPVSCDGQLLPIMKNLHAVLSRLRYPDRSRFLWADAICINQEDLEERGKQILLMADIYQQASKVLLWMGDAKKDTELVFALAEELARCYEERRIPAGHAPTERSGHITVDDRVFELLKAYWPAVTDIFTRPVFGRIWIVQEIVLGKEVEVICGPHRLPWPSFFAAALCIIHLGLVRDKPPHDTQTRLLWGRISSLGGVQDSRQGLASADTNSLHTLANLFLGHAVTDSRDRIYGMLSMVVAESEHGRAAPILPDYEKTVEEIYQEAFEWSIKDSKSLAMLDLCDAPATNIIPWLPTWVPDLTKGPQLCAVSDRLPYSGSLLSLFRDQFQPSVSGKRLRTKALIFDAVSFARSPCTESGKHLVMMEQFHLFAFDKTPYPTGGTMSDAVWRTFITNSIKRREEARLPSSAPADYSAHFTHAMSREMLRQLRLPERLTGQEPDLQETADPYTFFSLYRLCPGDVQNNLSILALRQKHPFIQLLYDSLRSGDGALWVEEVRGRDVLCFGEQGRQFFVTEKGFMGLGPVCPKGQTNEDGDVMLPTGSGVRPKDVVAVLAGSDHPWILRKDPRSNFYTIVGSAYVYGLTEGFCFEPGSLPAMETIVIK